MAEPLVFPQAFQQQTSEWERKSKLFGQQQQASQQKMNQIQERLTALTPKATRTAQRAATILTLGEGGVPLVFSGEEARIAKEIDTLEAQLPAMKQEFLKSIFYTDLYSQLPYMISKGAVSSEAEALSSMSLPDLTDSEMAQVKSDIGKLLASRSSTEMTIPELAPTTPTKTDMPPLQPPSRPQLVVSLNKIAVQDILKQNNEPTQEEIIYSLDGKSYWNTKLKKWRSIKELNEHN